MAYAIQKHVVCNKYCPKTWINTAKVIIKKKKILSGNGNYLCNCNYKNRQNTWQCIIKEVDLDWDVWVGLGGIFRSGKKRTLISTCGFIRSNTVFVISSAQLYILVRKHNQ